MHRCHGHRAVGAFQIAILAPCALVGAGYFVSVASCTEIGSARLRLHAGLIGAAGWDRSVPDRLGQLRRLMTAIGRGK